MPWVLFGTWTRGVRGWVLWRSAHRCLVGSVLRSTPGKGRGSKGIVRSWLEMAAKRSLILLLPSVPDQPLDAVSPEVNDGWRAKAICRQPSRPRTPSLSLKGDLDTCYVYHKALQEDLLEEGAFHLGDVGAGKERRVVQAKGQNVRRPKGKAETTLSGNYRAQEESRWVPFKMNKPPWGGQWTSPK